MLSFFVTNKTNMSFIYVSYILGEVRFCYTNKFSSIKVSFEMDNKEQLLSLDVSVIKNCTNNLAP